MKPITRILLVALALAPGAAAAVAPLSGTSGSNLTSYNPNGGAANNNQWNGLMNNRGMVTAPTATADFGNCNSLILRCASPKCSGGGCTDINVAATIVSGCVNSNDSCKQYGNDLIQYIAAQLVASSTARANEQAAAAAAAQAAASAQADAATQQMQMMQTQMQKMQEAMDAQTASMKAALEESQRQTAEALAAASAQATAPVSAPSSSASYDATAASGATGAGAQTTTYTPSTSSSSSSGGGTVLDGLTEAQRIAVANGVPVDVMARDQVAPKIMQYLDDANAGLAAVKAAMDAAITYAGCDSKGDNCAGPKRVSVFKQKAMAFFDPYEAVLDSLYDALITAQSVGIDIGDIYMMLNDSCNTWAEYICYGGLETKYKLDTTGMTIIAENEKGEEIRLDNIDAQNFKLNVDGSKVTTVTSWATYNPTNCPNPTGGTSRASATTRGGIECTQGSVIPPEDSPGCTINRILSDMDKVQRNFLFAENGDIDEHIRIGCASTIVNTSRLFRGRKRQAQIDIETLKNIISQDATTMTSLGLFNKNASNSNSDKGLKYCAITSKGYQELRNAATKRTLPSRVCVTEAALANTFASDGFITASMTDDLSKYYAGTVAGRLMANPYASPYMTEAACTQYNSENTTSINMHAQWANNTCECRAPGYMWVNGRCTNFNEAIRNADKDAATTAPNWNDLLKQIKFNL